MKKYYINSKGECNMKEITFINIVCLGKEWDFYGK